MSGPDIYADGTGDPVDTDSSTPSLPNTTTNIAGGRNLEEQRWHTCPYHDDAEDGGCMACLAQGSQLERARIERIIEDKRESLLGGDLRPTLAAIRGGEDG